METIKKARELELKTRRQVDSTMAGEHFSLFKGRGVEFCEMREYEPGDDVRTIDWKVTARVGRPYVRRYVEERELPVYIFIDVSGSSGFGTRGGRKLDLAMEVSSFLGLAAVKSGSPLGFIAFSDRVETFILPRKGRRHLVDSLGRLMGLDPHGKGTDIGAALTFFNGIARRRGMAFIISDFISGGFSLPLRAASVKHDIIPVVISDPIEERIPDVGFLELEDMECGGRIVIDTRDEEVRKALAAKFAAVERERGTLFQDMGIDHIRIETGESYMEPIVRLFYDRRRR
jgi:uncharacterized protein (DUF58 family)